MTRNLKAAGLPNSVLERIPDTVKTCRECRVWQTPGNNVIPSVTLPERFGQHVETDLMFYKQYIICHCIDRCTRWHASSEVPNKEEQTLLDAIHSTWISIHGPPEFLYTDGESGLTTDSAKAHMVNQGIQLKIRAPQQHAVFIERRGAILRVCMHVIEEQAKREEWHLAAQ